MPISFRRGLWSLGLASVVTLGLIAIESVRGQVAILGDSSALEKKYPTIKLDLQEMINGKKATADVLDTAAKYHVYRVTWPIILDAKAEAGKTEPIQKVLADFTKHVADINVGKKNGSTFTNAYAPVLVGCFREITDMPVVAVSDIPAPNTKRVVYGNLKKVLYGVQMLPSLAKLQHPLIDDYLTELISLDPEKGKHDLIKLWAIIAMRELPPVEIWFDPADPSDLQNKTKTAQKARDLKRVEALTRFILRPPPVKGVSESDSQQQIEAYRYLRREALETLGKMGAPAVSATKLTGKIEGPIAPVLLKALIPGAMTPDTNLQERNEAALGLCNMKPMGDKYDPSNVHFFIASTLAELANEYNKDLPNIVKKEGEDRLPTHFPWKIISRRWEAALKQHSIYNAKDKRAAELENAALKSITKGMFGAKGATVDTGSVERMLQGLAPKTAEINLFKGLPSEPIRLDAKKDE